MIVINPTELRSHQKKYFDLAEKERVIVKRGRKIIELVVSDSVSISPSNDLYYDNPENVAELKRRIKEIEDGKAEFTTLTKKKQKELLGL